MLFDERPGVRRLEQTFLGCGCAYLGLCLLVLGGIVAILAFLT